MIRNRIILKAFAVFCLIEMLSSTVLPTVSWALTSGPTAPEATSFEPVDTTDLVNLSTGDLAYNIPLLEVPGPSGGYPLSLSYHAGIQPNEDASWVGLGWTLNPGAILRNVNGTPDDFFNVQNSTRYYWDGGHRESFEVGVTIGLGGIAGVTAGVSFSQDTYQGSGVGGEVGIGVRKDYLRGGATVGISPSGGPYASAGVSLSTPLQKGEGDGVGGRIGIGISTNFESVSGSLSGGISYDKATGKVVDGKPQKEEYSMIGGSLSTSGKGSMALGGASISYGSAQMGRVSTRSNGFSFTIPAGLLAGVSLGYNYQRYWIDETDKINVNGAMFSHPDNPQASYFDQNSFDNYSLLDIDSVIADKQDPENQLGGSFPNYDHFYVHAQGVSGNMRPYYYQKHLAQRNNYVEEENSDGNLVKRYKSYQYVMGNNANNETRPEFRFVGDFSNRFDYNAAAIKMIPEAGYDESLMDFDFGWSADLKKGEAGNEPYTNNVLAGSRHIVYLTNDDIRADSAENDRAKKAGFIETLSSGFSRASLSGHGIGAMIITNETGVRYHFALPVMTADEYTYAENISNTLTFNESKNPHPYAYTWLLTAVTGADYVDRGPSGDPDGILNEYDWGYWVSFEYGKWTDQYYWRNPSEGMMVDIDNQFKKFSEGRKELYFLDAIRTKSHTALFVKDIREDAKSTVYSFRDIVNRVPFKINKGTKEILTDVTKQGGFIPKQITNKCVLLHSEWGEDPLADDGIIQYYTRPTSSLKLNKILLFNNESLNVAINKTGGFGQQFSYQWQIAYNAVFPDNHPGCAFASIEFNQHLYQNVLDVHDYNALPSSFHDNALRVIEFETDYSLSPETANSFNSTLANVAIPSTNEASYPLSGKLTLKKLTFKGKGGVDLTPGMTFDYDLDNPLMGSGTIAGANGEFTLQQQNSGLQQGDLIKFTQNNKDHYALIKDVNNGVHGIKILGRNIPPTASTVVHWRTTKNPPYNKDAYDIWGLYKSDMSATLLATNESAARLVSPRSAKSLDAWSLRSIQSSLGSKTVIEYGPDQYQKPVLSLNNLLHVKDIRQKAGSSNYEFVLYDDIDELASLFVPFVSFNYTVLLGHPFVKEELSFPKSFEHEVKTGTAPIVNIYKTNGEWIIETTNQSALFAKRINNNNKVYAPPIEIACNIPLFNEHHNYGGGLRVESITLVGADVSNQTRYEYTTLDNAHTSGVTSYEPGGLDQGQFVFPEDGELEECFENGTLRDKAKSAYNKALSKNFEKLLANAREITPPGVLYEYVKVKESIIHKDNTVVEVPNHSVYHFTVFHAGMLGVLYDDYKEHEFSQPIQYQPGAYLPPVHKVKSRSVAIKNFTAQVGLLKSVSLYHGNEKITETINHYLHDGITEALITSDDDPAIDNKLEANVELYENQIREQFNGQGIIHETFSDSRFVKQDYNVNVFVQGVGLETNKAFHLLGAVSKREEYPAIPLGQTSINYKSGIVTKSENLAFDFYSGQAISTKSTDGYGNTFVSISRPAYKEYDAMKPGGLGGLNMLTQEAASYTYKVNPANISEKLGLVSASIQTWSDQVKVAGGLPNDKQPGIWRKEASYVWKGDDAVARTDGFYPYSNFAPKPFNFANPSASDGQWEKNAQITLYDVQSHALEARDINNQYAATRMSTNNHTVFATAANARYDEFAYTGVEDNAAAGKYSGVEMLNGVEVFASGDTDKQTTHTGRKAVKLTTPGTKALKFSLPVIGDKVYHASVWVNSLQGRLFYKLNGVTSQAQAVPSAKKQAGTWYLLEADIPVLADGTLEVWCETLGGVCHFDDFRVHPFDAAMMSYVYNKWGELSHIIDNNNLYTEYRYDNMGRLKETYKESFQRSYGNEGVVKLSEVNYNYGAKNPLMVNVTASVTGVGSIYPSGNVSVVRGQSQTFTVAEVCTNPKFQKLLIDGKQINMGQASHTLYDGTLVAISNKTVTFSNIQSAHTIQAVFHGASSGSSFACHYSDGCYNGRFDYTTYNECGVPTTVSNVVWESIPAEIRGLQLKPNCCVQNGPNSNCYCQDPQQ